MTETVRTDPLGRLMRITLDAEGDTAFAALEDYQKAAILGPVLADLYRSNMAELTPPATEERAEEPTPPRPWWRFW